jgi:hypothetical protein
MRGGNMQTGNSINGKLISNLVLCGALIVTVVFFYALFSAIAFQHYITVPLIGVLSPLKIAGLGITLSITSPVIMIAIKSGNRF